MLPIRLLLLLCVLPLVGCHRAAEGVAFPYVHQGRAMPAARPGDPVMLSVVTPTGRRTFTYEQLRALPAARYRAYQPQLKREFLYEGVPLLDLVRATGLPQKGLRIEADNPFSAVIPPSDYVPFPVMIAYMADGKPLRVMDKGPLTVVYPNIGQVVPPADGQGPKWVWFVVSVRSAP